MTDVIRIRCDHGVVATFILDQDEWGALSASPISQVAHDRATQEIHNQDPGTFIEYRYMVRCRACGPRGITADVTAKTLHRILNAYVTALPRARDMPLRLFARAAGRVQIGNE